MNPLRRLLPLLASCLVVACTPMWTRIDQPQLSGRDNAFTVTAPTGWVHLSGYSDALFITRDGPQIQFIQVSLQSPAQAFAHTRKSLPANALPSDLAALVLAELRADPPLANATVRTNTPASVAGTPGFRLLIEFRNSRGARFDRLIYGGQQGDKILLLSYQALHTPFFDRDLGDFEKLVASYRPGPAR